MNLNVLTDFTYNTRYYLTHPWKWVKELFSNIRAAWMRATKGFCYSDVWNWDDWFCTVTPLMLRHMADDVGAYPGIEPFDTPEKWHDWLYEMAECIEHIQSETWFDDNNEYTEEYYQSLDNEYYQNHNNICVTMTNTRPHREICKLYFKRANELNEVRQQALEDLGREFFSQLDNLWS